MKKVILTILCSSILTLTACSKKPDDANPAGAENKPSIAVPTLSTDNITDMKSDFAALQTLSTEKAKEAVEFQTETLKATQSGNKEALKTVVDQMKTYVEGFNKSLDDLAIKSSEVASIRDKMKESNKLGLEMAEISVSNTPDPQKIIELQKQASELQQTLLTDMQTLQNKINTAK